MIVNFDCEFCGRGQASPASNAGKTVTCRAVLRILPKEKRHSVLSIIKIG